MPIAPASAYRDELGSAAARVDELERLLGDDAPPRIRPAPPRIAAGRLALLLVVASLACLTGALGAVVKRQYDAKLDPFVVVPREHPNAAPAAPPKTLGAYEPDGAWNQHRGPWAMNVDGSPILVEMLWRRGAVADALYVGAFDDATLEPKWTAGPFEGVRSTSYGRERFSLVARGDVVVLADAAGLLRAFDAASGRLRGELPMRRGVTGACLAEDGTNRIVVGFGAYADRNTTAALFPWELHAMQPFFFDPAQKSVRPAPQDRYCQTAPYCTSGASGRTTACLEDPVARVLAAASAPAARGAGKRALSSPGEVLDHSAVSTVPGQAWKPASTWVLDDDRRVTFGSIGADERAYAVLSRAASREIVWRIDLEPFVARGTRVAESRLGTSFTVMSRERLAYAYLADEGAYAISIVDLGSGQRIVQRIVPGTSRATSFELLALEGHHLFLHVDGEVVVVDAEGGAIRGVLEAR